ncbi:MAG: MarR family transcriptional regulator [Paludibacteraceae bacterium]
MYEQLKLENQLCFPFYAVSRLIIRAYQDDLDALEITYPQYLVLMVLWEKDQVSVVEIGEKLILNTNTVTPLLKRMEVQGLILRVPSQIDQRRVIVSLTEKGKVMQQKAAQIPYNLIKKLNIDTGNEKIAEINRLKTQLYELIDLLKLIEDIV